MCSSRVFTIAAVAHHVYSRSVVMLHACATSEAQTSTRFVVCPRPAADCLADLVLGPDLVEVLTATVDVKWVNRPNAAAVRDSLFFKVKLDERQRVCRCVCVCVCAFSSLSWLTFSDPVCYTHCQEAVRGEPDVRARKEKCAIFCFLVCAYCMGG